MHLVIIPDRENVTNFPGAVPGSTWSPPETLWSPQALRSHCDSGAAVVQTCAPSDHGNALQQCLHEFKCIGTSATQYLTVNMHSSAGSGGASPAAVQAGAG
jgi:hypothetical protein